MSKLTSAEVKELAHYLRCSHSQIPNNLQLGKWLNAISRASGFRDWNTMTAVVPETPELERGDWGKAFIGFAVVCVPSRAPSYHLAHDRNPTSTMGQVADKLALSISSYWEYRFLGTLTTFSKLDESNTLEEPLRFDLPDRKKHSTAMPPTQVLIANGEMTIWLWWLDESYTVAEHHPEKSRSFTYYSLTSGSAVAANSSSTALFLKRLTGRTMPVRKCYYSTELPNKGNNMFVLIEVCEGSRAGRETNIFHNNYESAAQHTLALNSRLGLSQRDSLDISAVFSMYDPHYEEDYFDDYSHYND